MTEHYFTDDQPAAQHELRTVELSQRGRTVRLWSSDRVFSSGKLDLGTRQLLDVVGPVPTSGNLLDLGCGWGPLATYMALEAPEAKVWAVDVSHRALDLMQRNADRHNLENILVLSEADALEKAGTDDTRFDLIWSNPPVRIGKKPMQQLLSRWLLRLSENGEAYLVVARNLGADSLAKWLVEQNFNVDRVASKKGFRILRVTNGLENASQ